MMKTVCVITATRAEYGLLKNIIKLIEKDEELKLVLVATGTHLSKDFGYTVTEIREDKLPISAEIDILVEEEGGISASKTMAKAFYKFSDFFKNCKPDMLVVLGDRYELLPICACAMNEQIPISHISGGEITEGVIDDTIRHCVTKMSYLHFVSCEAYRKRVIQLGEEPSRVFNFGDVGVENICNMKLMSKSELEQEIGFCLDNPYGVVTFHPVTLEKASALKQLEELLNALKATEDMNFIITKSNADTKGKEINDRIDEFVEENKNCKSYYSLGLLRYLSAVQYSEFVIGNSSSGIVEVPAFGIPTINIGDRQKGRLQANSILNCEPEKEDIIRQIKMARREEFKNNIKIDQNPYKGKDTSKLIIETIKRFLYIEKIELKKQFYDVKFEI
ncbi:MAG: UDP-N-acetylglucosamine 2-epimerase (hydrolyzing) [Lachnospiraceae bacterium]|nr:UDP-N-acetylglucosamine 2-epimerase (hydrolyzing) [Lachnospiraceae bacterium]